MLQWYQPVVKMEEDLFSGEEPSDGTDQQLHETISSIEKSLEETPESPKQQDDVDSKSLSNESVHALPNVEKNCKSNFESVQSDMVPALPSEQELPLVQTSDTDKVSEFESSSKGGDSSEENQGANTQKLPHENVPSSDKNCNELCPVKEPVASETSKSPAKSEVSNQASRSPAEDSGAQEVSNCFENDDFALEGSQSPGRDEVSQDVNKSPKKNRVANEVDKSPANVEVSKASSSSPEKEEVVQRGSQSPGNCKETLPSNDSRISQEMDGIERNLQLESEHLLETSTTDQRKGDNDSFSHLASNFVPDTAPLEESKGFEGDISSGRKRGHSPDKQLAHRKVESLEGDKIVRRNKKIKSPPKETDNMLQRSSTEKVFKKRGRPFKKKPENSSAHVQESALTPIQSTTTQNEDIASKTNQSATRSKEETTFYSTFKSARMYKKKPLPKVPKSIARNGVTTVKNEPKQQLRRPKGMVESDDTPLFLPEGWIFQGSVRQQGGNVGHIDMYYWTPPPKRIKLRSRQELQIYLDKHGLDFDPLRFFVRPHLFHSLEKGLLKYHDPRTIISLNLDEATIAHIIPMKHKSVTASDNGLQQESEVKSSSRKSVQTESVSKSTARKPMQNEIAVETTLQEPIKNGDKKVSSKRKSFSSKKSSFKRRLSNPSEPPSKIAKLSPRTKLDPILPELPLRKVREKNKNSGAKSQAESCESNSKEFKESDTVTIKSEITSPEKVIRKTRSSVGVGEVPLMLPAKATRKSKQVVENVDIVLSPKTPVKGKVGRPRKAVRPSSPPPVSPPPSPPQSDMNFAQRVIIQSKPKIVRSPYFSSSSNTVEQPVSSAGRRREKNTDSAPPRSPFNLIQEDLFHDPWQMLIATIFLNSTSGRIAIPLALEFLKRWPTPQEACQAKLYDILDVIEPLGFGRTRAAIIIRFSHEFLTKDWKLPNDLYGIGKYGTDSYKIFCMKNAWKKVESDDPMLMMYLNWRRATEHLRKKFLNSEKNSKATDPDEQVIRSSTMESVASGVQNKPKEDEPFSIPRKRLRRRTK